MSQRESSEEEFTRDLVLNLHVPDIWDVKIIKKVLIVSGGNYVHLLSCNLRVIAVYCIASCDIYSATFSGPNHIIAAGSTYCVHILTQCGFNSNNEACVRHEAYLLHGSSINSVCTHSGYVFSCSASPGGSLVVSRNGITLMQCPQAHEDCADVTVSGQRIYTVGADGQIKMWVFDYQGFYKKYYGTSALRAAANVVDMVEFSKTEAKMNEYASYYSSENISPPHLRNKLLEWRFHSKPTHYEARATKQTPLLLRYEADAVYRCLYPIDSVYEHEGVIVAHSPQFGFIFVYYNTDVRFDTAKTPIRSYKDAIIIGLTLKQRNLFWFKCRGLEYSVAVGGIGYAWLCTFPSRRKLSECSSLAQLLSYFYLRQYKLPNAVYRAVIPIDYLRIVACGVEQNEAFVVVAAQYEHKNPRFDDPVDDVRWTPNQTAYMLGESPLSWHPGNGVSVGKQ